MKKILPHRIKFNLDSEVAKSPTADKNVLTNATIKKMELVKEVKSLYESGCSFREITRRIGLNRKTVSRYVKFDDIENAATYSASNRTSQTDEYAKIIKEIYMSVHSVTELKKELEKRNIFIKYNTLTYHVRNRIRAFEEIKSVEVCEYIKRRDIINFILDWKYDKKIDKHLKDVIEKNPIISTLKEFYKLFKKTLVGLDRNKMIDIIATNHESDVLQRFIANLKTDYEAVINASTHKMNNGIVEGNVNKVKVIKRDMYGRALIDLLKAKVIYQSHFL